MASTGYFDTFNRTVSNSLGVATSGQTYTLSSAATQYSVGSNMASIAVSVAGDNIGWVDTQTSDIDIIARVALSAIPATNSAQVGFVVKQAPGSNNYTGTLMVAAGGAMSLRIAKRVAGVGGTVTTVATGLTYVANTFYNLRFQAFWSQPLQANVLRLKLWAVGAAEPGGWGAFGTDSGLTQYLFGTQAGLFGRDDSAVLGTITTKHQALTALSYSLPVPATTDPMCADPAFAFPKQTALESLADATDAVTATLDPLTSLAGLFPRVRLSTTGPFTLGSVNVPWTTAEFNVNTPTNLAYDNTTAWLGPGIWLATFELELASPFVSTDYAYANFFATNEPASSSVFETFRTNGSHTGDQARGGCDHMSKLVISTDPVTPVRLGVTLFMNSGLTYNGLYAALTAIKISDYFA